jgi:hypothetical protein
MRRFGLPDYLKGGLNMGVHEALALMVDFGSLVVALLTLAVAITVALNQKK